MTTFFDRTVRGQGAVSQQEASAFIAMVDRETSDLETGHIKGNLAGIREILVERPAVLPVIKPALAQLEAARYLAFADDYDARVYRKSESYSDFNRFLDSNPFNAKWGRCPLGRAATTGEPCPLRRITGRLNIQSFQDPDLVGACRWPGIMIFSNAKSSKCQRRAAEAFTRR